MRDGWNLTGDSFTRDEAGRFSFVARSDDMIISSGYNIAGPEVEAALLQPSLGRRMRRGRCARRSARHDRQGLCGAGFERTACEALTSELQDHVKQAIAPYKYPRAIEYVAQLPKTETGKLKRFALRQIAQGVVSTPGVAAE